MKQFTAARSASGGHTRRPTEAGYGMHPVL